MVAGFQWLPCYHGCWISTVSLLPWLLVFRGYSVAMVAGIPWLLCCHGCDTNRLLSDIETGDNVHDRAEFRVVYGFRVYQGLVEFLRVT